MDRLATVITTEELTGPERQRLRSDASLGALWGMVFVILFPAWLASLLGKFLYWSFTKLTQIPWNETIRDVPNG